MTPNKLPPLPEVNITDGNHRKFPEYGRGCVGYDETQMFAYGRECFEKGMLAEAKSSLRQSQSLPDGAVAGLAGKWRDESKVSAITYSAPLRECADELEQALQADAREKGDTVAYFPDDWQETLRKYGDCLAYADPDEGRVPLHLATQPAQASEKE